MAPTSPHPAERRQGIVLGDWVVERLPGWLRPNHLTLLRIALAIAILVLQAAAGGLGLVILLGLLAGGSDLLDGALARRRGQETRLGALLDPVADKLFAFALAYVAWGRGLAGLALLLPFLVVEVHVVVIPWLTLAGRRRRGARLWPPPKVTPNRPGKLKTAWLAAALGLVLIGGWLDWAWLVAVGRLNLVVALVLGLWAEALYFRSWRRGEYA